MADGNRYEGDYKDGGKFHGTGTTPYTPHIPPSPLPPSQSNKMFIIIIIAVCGGFPFVVLYS